MFVVGPSGSEIGDLCLCVFCDGFVVCTKMM